MNALARYLAANGIRPADFAERIGRTQSFVSRICRGVHGVSTATAGRIERETNGAVPMTIWADEGGVGGAPHHNTVTMEAGAAR